MKNLKKNLFILLATVFCMSSCQHFEDLLDPSEMTTQESLASERKVAFVVENFYQVLPTEDVEAIAKAATSLTEEEMDEFIDLDYNQRIRLGENKEDTKLFRDFRRAANQLSRDRYQKALFGLSDDEYTLISNELLSSGQYDRLIELDQESASNGRQMACANGNWNSTGFIAVGAGASGEEQWPMNYEGSITICAPDGNCQDDCDLLFRSNPYSQYYYSSNIQAVTPAARVVITYDGATSHFSRRVAPNSNEEYLEMATGTRRVQLQYGFGNADNFANEIRTGLIIR